MYKGQAYGYSLGTRRPLGGCGSEETQPPTHHLSNLNDLKL